MKMDYINIGSYRDYEGDSFYFCIRFESKKKPLQRENIESFIQKSKIGGLSSFEWRKNSHLCLGFGDMMLWEVFGSWKLFCDTLELILKCLHETHLIFAVIYLDDECANLDNSELIKISRIDNSGG